MSDSNSSPQLVPGNRHVRDLIERIKQSAEKLESQGSTRGDLKIISRAMRELAYAFKVFTPYRRFRKVTVFGSARTQPDQPAYQMAVEFSRQMAQQDWLVITGAASGIMEAGHVGAGREHSMGLNILLPFEQDANHVIQGDEKLVHMKYFFTRKLMFVKECDAVVCLPGGFGTLDEAMEVLTLIQTGKHDPVPVIFLDAPNGTYWEHFNQFLIKELLHGDMISPDDTSLYLVTDSCQRAVEECVHFYRVYHSMRYVGDQLVLRLKQPLTENTLTRIRANYSNILVDGDFQQTDALKAESNEPDLADLQRLVFRFNRRSLAQLRLLINDLNSQAA
jgi:uncharacterized protein (TIGR00730 family)